MSHDFTSADHERALRAGQAAMAKMERRKRKRHPVWQWIVNLLLLLLTQLGAVIVAVVQFFHPVTFGFDSTVGALARAATWPVLISPHWGALLAAIGAFIVAGLLAAPPSEDSASGR